MFIQVSILVRRNGSGDEFYGKIGDALKQDYAGTKAWFITSNLGALNYERNQEWQLPFTAQNARPAMYAFDGDVFEKGGVNFSASDLILPLDSTRGFVIAKIRAITLSTFASTIVALLSKAIATIAAMTPLPI